MAFQALNWKKKSRNNSLGNKSWLCTSQVLLLNTVQPWQCSNPVPEPGIFTAHAHLNSQQVFSDLGFLFSPSMSLDQQRNHSVLANSGESVSEEPGQKDRGVWSLQKGKFCLPATTPGQVGWRRNSCRHPQKYFLSGKLATLLIIMQGLMKLNIIIPSHATFNFLDHNF